MAMAVRSSLNPNAPLFIPAAYQQVEDFSPEWWELVKTTGWFRDHWFRQHQEQENFDGSSDEYEEEDVASMLPHCFDLGGGELSEPDLLQDEFGSAAGAATKDLKQPCLDDDVEAVMKTLSLKKELVVDPAKYCDKPFLIRHCCFHYLAESGDPYPYGFLLCPIPLIPAHLIDPGL